MINYYYYIEVKHTDSIVSPVSKVIIKLEDVPNIEYIQDQDKEKAYAQYVYEIWTAYRNNTGFYHYTLRMKVDNDCIHYLIAEHWTSSRLNTFYYTTYGAYKHFASCLSFNPCEKECIPAQNNINNS